MDAWRTGMPGRPEVNFGGWRSARRPLKRWRWVGVFTDEVMLCAAQARIAGVPVSWWAIWDRAAKTLAERTRKGRSEVSVTRAEVTLRSHPYQLQLNLRSGTGVETISLHGTEPIWTRKTPIAATGSVTLGDRVLQLVDAPGLCDESAGYHQRLTEWKWSAGVGSTTDGRRAAWNLVTGLHDDPNASERTVWIAGEPHHVPPQPFADDLTSIGAMQFVPEATRTHRENRLILASDYEQPFGSFEGSLPVAGEIRGYGVMERHAARW